MPVQTTYEAEYPVALEGQRTNLGLTNITSKAAEDSDIAFGRAVVRGTGDDQAKLPTGASQGFLGITELTSAWSIGSDNLHEYSENREMNIINFGEIWIYTEQSVVPGDAVYFRHTADIAPLNVIGRFRKDASGGDAELIVGASFESTAAAGEIAKINLNTPGVGILIAPDSSETLTIAGAAAIDIGITYFDTTAGAMAVTLADGTEGQLKTLMMLVDGGDVTVTPANYANGTTIVFNDVYDVCVLQFIGTSWKLKSEIGINTGIVTIVATSGAIPLTKDIVYFDTTAGVSTATLADGFAGQKMFFKMLVDGGNMVITPVNFLDGSTITFDAVGDSLGLIFDGVNWGVDRTTATIA